MQTLTKNNITSIKEKVLTEKEITLDEAQFLANIDIQDTKSLMNLFQAANEVREFHKGKEISLCSIVNAKSGYCAEDCGFCSQASQYNTSSPQYKLLSIDELKNSIDEADQNGATEFSFVTSGTKISKKEELETIGQAITYTKEETEMEACTSLGFMKKEELQYLKDCGMDHYHHNVETAKSHFSNVISSHSYEDEVESIRAAKELGLYTCCGGIFGMGESWDQRLELAFDLKEIGVDSIPINFLNPLDGTPLAELPLLKPFEALKIVAIYRLIFPDKDVMVMGGREKILGDLQSWIFLAGANGMLLGNYLTTSGRSVDDDLKMIDDLGLVAEKHC